MRQGRIQRRTRSPDRSFADMGVSTEAIDTYPFDRMAGMPFPTITTAPKNRWASESRMLARVGTWNVLQSGHCSTRPVRAQASF